MAYIGLVLMFSTMTPLSLALFMDDLYQKIFLPRRLTFERVGFSDYVDGMPKIIVQLGLVQDQKVQ